MEFRYRGHRFPSAIISHAVWLYHRFSLRLRDIEDLLAERGSHAVLQGHSQVVCAVRPCLARALRYHQGRLGDILHLDEVFISIRGERRDF